jgi:FHS family L-fucose permease-like MFS transporter
VFPYVGSILILGSLGTVETKTIVHTYLGLATALAVVAAVVWSRRNKLKEIPSEPVSMKASLSLLKRARFSLGVLGIFAYVGAEVTVGSIMVLYLRHTMQLDGEAAGKLVAYYWGGAMIGRFAGSAILRLAKPGKVLAAAAALAITLLLCSGLSAGAVAGWTLIAIGLCNSIMFPTIFSLACEGLGPRAAEGSGVICMAIVGGAILPPIAGLVSDHASLQAALVVPAVAYLFILSYGLFALRPVAPIVADDPR